MDYLDNSDLKRWQTYAEKNLEKIGEKFENKISSPIQTTNFPIFKGQIIKYFKKYDLNGKVDCGLAIALEDSLDNEKTVFICPIYSESIINKFINNDSNKKKYNSLLFKIGLLPLINKQYNFYAKIDAIKILNKRLIDQKDKKIFSYGYGQIPSYIINELQIKYLCLTEIKFKSSNIHEETVFKC